MTIIDKVKPIGNRIIVKIIERENKVGSIYIPDQSPETLLKAEVLAIGDEVEGFEVGDIVLLRYYVGIPIDFPECDLAKVNIKIVVADEIIAKWIG